MAGGRGRPADHERQIGPGRPSGRIGAVIAEIGREQASAVVDEREPDVTALREELVRLEAEKVSLSDERVALGEERRRLEAARVQVLRSRSDELLANALTVADERERIPLLVAAAKDALDHRRRVSEAAQIGLAGSGDVEDRTMRARKLYPWIAATRAEAVEVAAVWTAVALIAGQELPGRDDGEEV